MQLRYVFSETTTALRRNLSMTVALVVTLFISLTLAGFGLLLHAQADKAQSYWDSKLQITVFLCTDSASEPTCAAGAATPQQKEQIRGLLATHPEVKSFRLQSREEAYRIWKRVYANQGSRGAYQSAVKPSQMPESYWVTLKNPQQYAGVEEAVQRLPGVQTVRDLHQVLQPVYQTIVYLQWAAFGIAAFLLATALLLVGNAIRLAAYARRREIGIMRLVGASRMFIQLPFLMETALAGVVGTLLSAGALAAFMYFVVYGRLVPNSRIMEWVTWNDAGKVGLQVLALAIALTVVPTLLLTRKYLRV